MSYPIDENLQKKKEIYKELLEKKVTQLKESLIQQKKNKIGSNLNFKSNFSKDEYFEIISLVK